LTFTPRRSL